MATFAALVLALAAVGLYGVLSYSVSQRRRELGVRAALGATQRDLLRLVVGQGLALAGAGIALGLAGAAALARLMANVLFGVTPHDAVVFATAPLLLLVIAFAACLLPGGRAASADPAEASALQIVPVGATAVIRAPQSNFSISRNLLGPCSVF